MTPGHLHGQSEEFAEGEQITNSMRKLRKLDFKDKVEYYSINRL